jgi:Domain of unknown function (DU1801)
MAVRPPIPELLKFLSAYDKPIVELALAARKKVLTMAPRSTETIYDAYSAVAIGYSFTGRLKEGFCHIAVYSAHVNLGFNQGIELPDPDRLLQGTGTRTRHLTLRAPDDVNDPRLARLLRAAIQNGHIVALSSNVPVIPPTSVVKAIYARKRRPVKK